MWRYAQAWHLERQVILLTALPPSSIPVGKAVLPFTLDGTRRGRVLDWHCTQQWGGGKEQLGRHSQAQPAMAANAVVGVPSGHLFGPILPPPFFFLALRGDPKWHFWNVLASKV
jgi:hypothetical protein